MRTEEDIINLRVTTFRDLSVDMELIEMSPRYRTIRESLEAQFPTESDTSIAWMAIQAYLVNYITNDEFPRNMPGTTGPGTNNLVSVEELSNVASENDVDGNRAA